MRYDLKKGIISLTIIVSMRFIFHSFFIFFFVQNGRKICIQNMKCLQKNKSNKIVLKFLLQSEHSSHSLVKFPYPLLFSMCMLFSVVNDSVHRPHNHNICETLRHTLSKHLSTNIRILYVNFIWINQSEHFSIFLEFFFFFLCFFVIVSFSRRWCRKDEAYTKRSTCNPFSLFFLFLFFISIFRINFVGLNEER